MAYLWVILLHKIYNIVQECQAEYSKFSITYLFSDDYYKSILLSTVFPQLLYGLFQIMKGQIGKPLREPVHRWPYVLRPLAGRLICCY